MCVATLIGFGATPAAMNTEQPIWSSTAKASRVLTSGSDMTKSCSWAFWAASMTFSIVASLVLLPYLMLSAMLQSNSTGSWETIPIFDRRNCTFIFLVSCPSINYQETGENLKHHSKTTACKSQIVHSKTAKSFSSAKMQTQLILNDLKNLLIFDSFVCDVYFLGMSVIQPNTKPFT